MANRTAFGLVKATLSHFRTRMKSGFTLAEVLITLGIIGIVAVITLPSLIVNYEKKVTVTRLKQTYAQLQQAIALSEIENGKINTWDLSQENSLEKYLIKYLKLSKGKTEFKIIGEEDYIPYKQISGKQEVGLYILNNPAAKTVSYILANGVELITHFFDNGIGIVVDLNTSSKKPNQFGKDTFMFSVVKDYGLQFAGIIPSSECPAPELNRNYFLSGTNSCVYVGSSHNYKYECDKDGRGMWCGALIMIDGWEIKDDYPW